MAAGRVRSGMLAPALRRLGPRRPRPNSYAAFIAACRDDPRIDVLQETANTCRTLAAAFLLLAAAYALNLSPARPWLATAPAKIASLGGLAVLFALSYRRQSPFVARRVAAHAARCAQDSAREPPPRVGRSPPIP